MTYASLLLEDGIESNYLVVIKPRRMISSTAWTLVSGTVYSTPFAWGDVVSVTSNGTAQTLGTSAAVSSGQWYWDVAAEVLYVNVGADPDTKDVVVTYEIHVSTKGASWHRIPTDTESRIVYFDPIISSVPTISLSASDNTFGFIPSQSSSMTLSNEEHFIEDHASESSFCSADVELYHWLGESLDAGNMKLIYTCLCTGIDYSSDQVTLQMTDRNTNLDQQYRPASSACFYTTTAFPNLDPEFANRPIRYVYGEVDGLVGVNIDYSAVEYTGSSPTDKNRDWILMKGEATGNITRNVISTAVMGVIVLDSVEGLRRGDMIRFYRANDETKESWYYIKTVTESTNTIKVSVINDWDPGAEIEGSGSLLVTRYWVRNGVWVQSETGIVRFLWPGFANSNNDFAMFYDATNDVSGITLKDNFEDLYGSFSARDVVYFNVVGNANTATIGGSAFGSTSSNGGLSQGVVILYDLLKRMGVIEAKIDTTAFAALQSTLADEVGFAIPHTSREDFPTYRDLLSELLQTLMLRLYVDSDGKWTVVHVKPMGSPVATITADEIIDGSVSYSLDTREIITTMQVEYALREVGAKHEVGTADRSTVAATSQTAVRLHGIEKQRTIQSLHTKEAEAQALADRLGALFSSRQGILKLKTTSRLHDLDIGDVVSVEREALPGFEYEKGTARTKSFVVVGISKDLSGVELELDDQKGIEDNAGEW